MHVFDMVVAAGRDLADVGGATTELVDSLKSVVDPRFVGDRQHVQHSVGAPAHRHVEDHRVVNGLGSDDFPWQEPMSFAKFVELQDHFHDSLGRPPEEPLALGAGGQQRAVARQCHAQGLAEAIHAVGRKETGAGATRRAARLLQLE